MKVQVITPSDEFKGLNPYQKLRALEALKHLRDGRIQVPKPCCGWCQSESLMKVTEEGERMWQCLSCSRFTRTKTAHTIIKQKIRRIILDGVDLPKGRDV